MKKYWTIALRYETDSGEPCNPPPHITDRIVAIMPILHEMGWACDIRYGWTDKDFMDLVDDSGDE